MKVIANWCPNCGHSFIETNQAEVKNWSIFKNHKLYDRTDCIKCGGECKFDIIDDQNFDKWVLNTIKNHKP